MQDSDIIKLARDTADNIHSRGPVLAASALHRAADAIGVLSDALKTPRPNTREEREAIIAEAADMRATACDEALRLLGWDGETDPVAWAKGRTTTNPKGQIFTAGRITTCDNHPQEFADDLNFETTSGILIQMSDDDVRAAGGMLYKTVEIREVAP